MVIYSIPITILCVFAHFYVMAGMDINGSTSKLPITRLYRPPQPYCKMHNFSHADLCNTSKMLDESQRGLTADNINDIINKKIKNMIKGGAKWNRACIKIM